MRLLAVARWVLLVSSASACTVDAGPCDPAAASALVYHVGTTASAPDRGVPMYAGQALLVASCGDGRFCHASDAEGRQRHGVPRGLDFDLAPAAYFGPCDATDPVCASLGDARDDVLAYRGRILALVRDGDMPPGDIGDAVASRGPSFVHADASTGFDLDVTDPARYLPRIDDPAAYAVLRNWLACGAPVVESTRMPTPAADTGTSCSDTSGEPFPRCVVRVAPEEPDEDGQANGDLPAADWSSIYAKVIAPYCAQSCHGRAEPSDLDLHRLDLSSQQVAYANLVGVPADGRDCRGRGLVRVVPEDADASLLYTKLTGEAACGAPMPSRARYGLLPGPLLAPIRAWIEAGANP